MKKMTKTAMYMMGTGMAMAASYYMGLPKSKKNALKSKMKDMMNIEKDMLDDYMN